MLGSITSANWDELYRNLWLNSGGIIIAIILFLVWWKIGRKIAQKVIRIIILAIIILVFMFFGTETIGSVFEIIHAKSITNETVLDTAK